MTEAMSRREIEDVLSSIRRIVSHDVNPSPTSAQQGDLSDKLILTSALRVDEDAAETPPDTCVSDTVTTPEPDAALSQPAADEPANAPNASSLLGRIASASKPPAAVVADEAGQPALPEGAAPLPLQDSEADLPASLEDSALEATLARLEAVLAGSVLPGQGDTSPEAADPTGDEVIDEGVLYQLVAHIVRQELQGELGEKITRNIRKLVRAEVARELQLRNF